MLRDRTSCTSMSAVSMPTPITRANRRHHLAVIPFAAQPAEKSPFKQLGIEPVCLGAPVLARYGDARCVNDMGLDVVRPQPARQPEAITPGLKGHGDAFDPASCFLRFLPPAAKQLQ